MLRLWNIGKRFGKQTVLEGLDLHLTRGEIFGLLGPNGAGKSTTLKIIAGLIKPDCGLVSLNGDTLAPGRNMALGRVGAQIDSPAFPGQLSGRDNLRHLARLQGLNNNEAEYLLNAVMLTQDADRPVRTYSTGMLQRLGIAAAMLGEPPLVILDEPTSGLDPQGRDAVLKLIRGLARQHDLTVLFTSHIFEEVAALCDRVGLLHNGALVHVGGISNMHALRELYFNCTGSQELAS